MLINLAQVSNLETVLRNVKEATLDATDRVFLKYQKLFDREFQPFFVKKANVFTKYFSNLKESMKFNLMNVIMEIVLNQNIQTPQRFLPPNDNFQRNNGNLRSDTNIKESQVELTYSNDGSSLKFGTQELPDNFTPPGWKKDDRIQPNQKSKNLNLQNNFSPKEKTFMQLDNPKLSNLNSTPSSFLYGLPSAKSHSNDITPQMLSHNFSEMMNSFKKSHISNLKNKTHSLSQILEYTQSINCDNQNEDQEIRKINFERDFDMIKDEASIDFGSHIGKGNILSCNGSFKIGQNILNNSKKVVRNKNNAWQELMQMPSSTTMQSFMISKPHIRTSISFIDKTLLIEGEWSGISREYDTLRISNIKKTENLEDSHRDIKAIQKNICSDKFNEYGMNNFIPNNKEKIIALAGSIATEKNSISSKKVRRYQEKIDSIRKKNELGDTEITIPNNDSPQRYPESNSSGLQLKDTVSKKILQMKTITEGESSFERDDQTKLDVSIDIRNLGSTFQDMNMSKKLTVLSNPLTSDNQLAKVNGRGGFKKKIDKNKSKYALEKRFQTNWKGESLYQIYRHHIILVYQMIIMFAIVRTVFCLIIFIPINNKINFI